MAKRVVAAILLVAMAAWSEMALAPMLGMRHGDMLAGRAMAGEDSAEPTAHHHANMSGAMPCCPRMHTGAEPLLVVAADYLPCADAHRCCFGQGPQSKPAPAGSVRRMARSIAAVPAALINRAVSTPMRADDGIPALRASPNLFGMIFRV